MCVSKLEGKCSLYYSIMDSEHIQITTASTEPTISDTGQSGREDSYCVFLSLLPSKSLSPGFFLDILTVDTCIF